MDNETQGFKWPVTAAAKIAAPARDVWGVISQPGNLELCHPFCATNPVMAWPGAAAMDEVHYLSGWIYQRRFRDWFDGTGYDLEIYRGDDALAAVSWRIEEIDEQCCELRITVYPYGLQKLPVVIRWLPHVMRLRPMLAMYLESVVKGFEWFVVKGSPVPRNQFGTHPWFSWHKAASG